MRAQISLKRVALGDKVNYQALSILETL